jgi:hypothetical protein
VKRHFQGSLLSYLWFTAARLCGKAKENAQQVLTTFHCKAANVSFKMGNKDCRELTGNLTHPAELFTGIRKGLSTTFLQ